MTTKLQVKGGTGAAIIPFLKKIGFVASDGTPTDLYKHFRNPSSGGSAIADAIKLGYRELLQVNEYFYELPDKELLALIVQVTGTEADNSTAKHTLSTFKNLRSFANFELQNSPEQQTPSEVQTKIAPEHQAQTITHSKKVGLNLSYTINLNLPATSDQAVFNAIFRSLKEHLLSHDE